MKGKVEKNVVKEAIREAKVEEESRILKDVKTDEIIETAMVRKRVKRDFFYKVALADLLSVLDLLGNKKIFVLEYLLAKMDSKNMIIITQQKIAKDLNISRRTAAEAMSLLQERGIIKRIQNGVYQMNPKIVWFGSEKMRNYILIEYLKEEEDE